jgi:hypothetical protein
MSNEQTDAVTCEVCGSLTTRAVKADALLRGFSIAKELEEIEKRLEEKNQELRELDENLRAERRKENDVGVAADASRLLANGLDPSIVGAVLIAQALRDVATSLSRIAHGDVTGPGGLEGLAIALAGESLRRPIGEALTDIADTLNERM